MVTIAHHDATPGRVGPEGSGISPSQRATATRAEASFTDFYRAHARRIVALAVALTGRRAIAEDLAQEAFARAYRDWGRIGGYDEPAAWVRRVVINLSRSRWRRTTREAALVRLAGGAPTPVELDEPATDLWRAVRRLPHRQAATVALHYVDDLPVAEIAALLGVAEGTTKSDLHRARTELARRLEEPR